MIQTNKDRLPIKSLVGQVAQLGTQSFSFMAMDPEGKGQYRVGTGGITYNYRLGDNCMDVTSGRTFLEGAVSICQIVSSDSPSTGAGPGIMTVMAAKTGLIRPVISGTANLDPDLLNKMGIEEKDGQLVVPVTHIIPSCMMGSGKGFGYTVRGDYDVMTSDAEWVKKTGLDTLRFGDIVMLQDQDNTYGRAHHPGAVTIGVVIHGDTYRPGHGPGITTLLSCRKPLIQGKIAKHANIAHWLGVKDCSK